MRVVVIHNWYRSALPSGENLSVESVIRDYEREGNVVRVLRRSSDDIFARPRWRQALAGLSAIGDVSAYREMRQLLRTFKPDLVHVENVYPLISPAVLIPCRTAGVPVVARVRSYRNVCMAGTFFRRGAPCFDCEGPFGPAPGVIRGCYQGSRIRSIPMAVSLLAGRRIWRSTVNAWRPTSEYLARFLIRWGIPDQQITVVPNRISLRRFDDRGGDTSASDEIRFFYAGRLERDKGVDLLLDAWRAANLNDEYILNIAGDGSLRSYVEGVADQTSNIRVLGLVPHDELINLMRLCQIVVAPSAWPEPFGRTISEAHALGKPVVATRVGGQAELITARDFDAEPEVASLAAALRKAAAASKPPSGATPSP